MCEHEWVDITRVGDERRQYICVKCNKEKEGERLMSYQDADPESYKGDVEIY